MFLALNLIGIGKSFFMATDPALAPDPTDNEITCMQKMNALLFSISGESNADLASAPTDTGMDAMKKGNQLLYDRAVRGAPSGGGGPLIAPITIQNADATLVLVLDFDAAGDLIATQTVGSHAGSSINLTNGFIGSVNVLAPPQDPIGPKLDSISPASVPAGSPDTVITFKGSGFASNMQPYFGDHLVSWMTEMINPDFIDANTFQGTLGSNLLSNPTSFFLFIVNGDGGDSNNLEFDVI